MRRFLRRSVLLAAPALLLPASGCTLLSFSTIGSLASLGNSSVSAGRDKYSFGRLTTAENASFEQAVNATLAAADDLGLKVKTPVSQGSEPTRADVAFVDDNGTQIGVHIVRRTPRLVDVRVDVGWFFGSEVTDRLFLVRLRTHLPPADAARPSAAPTPDRDGR